MCSSDLVKETARLTERRIQPDEEALDILNRRLEFIKEHIGEHPEVSVCFFRPDLRKEGGAYVTVSGTVKKLDEFRLITARLQLCLIQTSLSALRVLHMIRLWERFFQNGNIKVTILFMKLKYLLTAQLKLFCQTVKNIM